MDDDDSDSEDDAKAFGIEDICRHNVDKLLQRTADAGLPESERVRLVAALLRRESADRVDRVGGGGVSGDFTAYDGQRVSGKLNQYG
jgi:hypothetical protein